MTVETTATDPNLDRLLTEGELIPLAAVAKRLPPGRGGASVTPSCVYRWATGGVKTAGGRVRLEAVRIGSRMVTTWPAVLRFVAAQQADAKPRTAEVRTPQQRKRAKAPAEAELERMGV